jgi:hypothetical protein
VAHSSDVRVVFGRSRAEQLDATRADLARLYAQRRYLEQRLRLRTAVDSANPPATARRRPGAAGTRVMALVRQAPRWQWIRALLLQG